MRTLLLSLLLITATPAVASELPFALGPEAVYRATVADHPDLRASEWTVEAARHRLDQAGELPPLQLSATFGVRPVETALGPQRASLGAQQRFPAFGERGRARDVARAAASAAEAERFARVQRQWSALAAAWADVAVLDRDLEVVGEMVELLRYQEEVVRSRYRTGEQSQPDLLRTQIEVEQLEDRRRQLEARRPHLVARLNETLGREAAAPVPDRFPLPETPADVRVEADGADRNPELVALRARLGERRASVEEAARSGRPSLAFGLQYVFVEPSDFTSFDEEGRDVVLASLSLQRPWGRAARGRRAESEAAREATAARIEAQRRRVEAAAAELHFALEDARRRDALYEESLLPKGEQALRAIAAAYANGESSLDAFLDAERTLLQFELERARARADAWKAWTQWQAWIGEAPLASEAEERR